ncbi:MAG: hypothetical protein ACE5L7_04315 [Candidatus Aminicenantales bacterium]
MDIKKTMLIYQYAERIKSALIIAFKLMASYLEALAAEIRIAQNVEKSEYFLRAEEKTAESVEKLTLFGHEETVRCLREALTAITTSCQKAMEALERQNLLS